MNLVEVIKKITSWLKKPWSIFWVSITVFATIITIYSFLFGTPASDASEERILDALDQLRKNPSCRAENHQVLIDQYIRVSDSTLRSKYPLGYALLYKCWENPTLYIPRNLMDEHHIKVNFSGAHIERQAGSDNLSLVLPGIHFLSNNIRIGTIRCYIPSVEETAVTPVSVDGYEVVVETLVHDSTQLVCVIGLTQTK